MKKPFVNYTSPNNYKVPEGWQGLPGWDIKSLESQSTVGTPTAPADDNNNGEPRRHNMRIKKALVRRNYKQRVLALRPDAVCRADATYTEQHRYDAQFSVYDRLTDEKYFDKPSMSAYHAWRVAFYKITGTKDVGPMLKMTEAWINIFSDYTNDGNFYNTKLECEAAFKNGERKDRIGQIKIHFRWDPANMWQEE